jgi:hypothetical protein
VVTGAVTGVVTGVVTALDDPLWSGALGKVVAGGLVGVAPDSGLWLVTGLVLAAALVDLAGNWCSTKPTSPTVPAMQPAVASSVIPWIRLVPTSRVDGGVGRAMDSLCLGDALSLVDEVKKRTIAA